MKALLHEFDSRTTKDIQRWPHWVRPAMLLATLVGQPVFTVGTATLIAGIGWGAASVNLFFAGIIALITFGISTLAKLYFRRDRPVTEYVERMFLETYSMPSGHATGAVASYGLLALIICQMVPSLWQYFVAGVFTAAIVLIGISRIYLGAHYPSDVIAGWALGLLGLFASIVIYVA